MREYLERARSGETVHGELLTPREEEVVKLVAEAHTNDEIGETAAHLQEDGRAPPREHPREARHARPRRAHALRDPARARPTLICARIPS